MDRIVLLLEHKENRRLLEKQLARNYRLVPSSGAARLPDEPFDLAILDGPALDRLREQVQARKEAERPVFLPVLLITSRQEARLAARYLRQTVDELLLAPIEKLELQARVEILLRARHFSLESEHRYYALAGTKAARQTLNDVFGRISDGVVALDNDWRYTYLNAQAAQMLNREKPEDLLGRHIWTEYPEGVGQPFYKAYYEAVKTQQPIYLEEYYEPWDRWFENRIYPSPDGLTIYFTEITGRKRAEQALRESEERYRSLVENSPAGIVIHSEGKIVFANPAIARLVGAASPQELLGRDMMDFIHPDDRQIVLERAQAVQAGDRAIPTLEEKFLRLDGSAVDVEVTGVPFVYRGKPAVQVIVTDITERKRAEQALVHRETELRRINRALRVLSDCNQALIRADDEVRLLDDVCRILVSEGGYRLAWVGFALQDEARTVRPVAQAGYEDGYLDTVKITWADDAWGRGPTGRAIRGGEPVVLRDLLADPDYAPWRAEALRRGYASSIALPLLSEGQTFGALNIYAAEADAFDDPEVKLLQELADDLAYGLTALHTRAAHARAEEALRKSEEKFRSVVEQSADGIALTDEQGTVIAWNHSMEAVTGIPATELVGQPIWEAQLRLLPPAQQTPEALEGLRQSLQRFLQTGESPWAGQMLEREYHHPDGTEHYLQGTVFAIATASGFMLASLSRDVTAQKRAELALQAQLQRMEQLLSTTLDGYILADTEGQIVDVNPAYCNLIGYSRDELLQMNIEQLEGQLSPEEIEQRIALMVRQGGARFETRHRRKDGQLLNLEASITILQPETRPLVAAFVHDITERKRAEEALRESEERYRRIVENSPLGIAIHSEGRIIYANPAVARLVGAADPQELLGRDTLDFIHPDYRQIVLERVPTEPENDRAVPSREEKFLRLDGSVVDVEVASVPFVYQGKPAFQVIVTDITERKRAEAEIQRRNRELLVLNRLARRVSASLSMDQTVAAALDELLAAANPDLAMIFLRQGDDLILHSFAPQDSPFRHDETPLHRVGECLCGLAALRGRPVYATDIRHDRRCTWQECKLAGLRSLVALPLHGGDEVVGVLALASGTPRDFEQQAGFLETLAGEITVGLQNDLLHEEIQRHAAELEQRVAERTAELKVARDRAREADRVKSAFLATMSHELRTPLNSIIGFTGILLQKLVGPLNDEQVKQLGMVQDSARHLLELINDVLDISKIEAGQLEVTREPFDMRQAIRQSLARVAPLAEKKGLALTSQIAPDVGAIVSDRRRVEQILLNLLNNAIKFTPQGEVRLECHIENGRLVTRVIDTGIGIKPQDMDALFTPFQQVDTGIAREHEGTGLGLSICKRLVELLGGEIHAASEWGKGSVFSFTLPAERSDL